MTPLLSRNGPAPPSTEQDQTPEQIAVLKEVKEFFELCEKTHKQMRDRWNGYYELYRGYVKLKTQYETEGRAAILDATRTWSTRFHIPLTFATVETVVPRALSNDPIMRALPFSPDAKQAAQAVAKIFARDQKKIGYEIKLQETARRGFTYGLGVQKTYWQKKSRTVMQTVESPMQAGKWIAEPKEQILYEGPQAESVDNFDFFWHPAAKNVETCEAVLHRTWRSFKYVADRIQGGTWNPVDLDAVRRTMDESKHSEAWKSRQVAAGITAANTTGPLCEVWEYHTGTRVITILNQTFVVQDGENPAYHDELPFQIFRPTIVPGEFCGIGEIEMIETLNHELDTMRTQRRDSAAYALDPTLFIQEGFVDGDIKKGPGVVNPVIGNPRESIYVLDSGDLPSSSYMEENTLKADIERVTGMSEALSGSDPTGGAPGSETATGMQMVLGAANVRIALKAKNLLRETVRPAACQWLDLYKQHHLETQDIRVEDTENEDGYGFISIGPEDFAKIEEVEPEAGSTEPDNPAIAEEKARAIFNQMLGSPQVDQRKLTAWYLRENDIKDAESFLVKPGPSAAEAVEQTVRTIGMALEELNVDQEVIEMAITAAAQASEPIGPAPGEIQPEPTEGEANGT